MTHEPEITLGAYAYIAYRNQVGGKTFDGRPMPMWEELPENIRMGWEVAGRTVRTFTLAEVGRHIGDQLESATKQLLSGGPA